LLLGALREQETARIALEDGARGRFVASVSHDLAQSLDESAYASRPLPADAASGR
jgi:hypothetical protein